MTLQKLKPWLVLALIFVLGGVTGASLTVALGPRFMRPPGMAQMKNHMLIGLTHRLNLTPEQQAKIEPILADAQNQMQALHRDEVGRVARIMEDVNAKIAPILTPEQKTELQRMQKEMETQHDRMFPGHMRPWMHPGQPPPPGGLPPPDPNGVPPPPPPPGDAPK